MSGQKPYGAARAAAQRGKPTSPPVSAVYVSGRVEQVAVTLPQGSSLVQAVDLAGGTKVLHGKVEFIRFTRDGEIDRRRFGFKVMHPQGITATQC